MHPPADIACGYGATASIAFSIPGRPGGLADENAVPDGVEATVENANITLTATVSSGQDVHG